MVAHIVVLHRNERCAAVSVVVRCEQSCAVLSGAGWAEAESKIALEMPDFGGM